MKRDRAKSFTNMILSLSERERERERDQEEEEKKVTGNLQKLQALLSFFLHSLVLLNRHLSVLLLQGCQM